MMLSDVCLSVAYIGPKSRTERPRKTKIGTEVAHFTRDLDTTFNVKRSKVKVTRPLYSPRRLRIYGTYCYVAVGSPASDASAPTQGEGRWHIATAPVQLD